VSREIEVVRHFLDNFNAGDIDEAMTAFAPDFVYEGPVDDGIWWANGTLHGPDQLLAGIIDGVDDHFERLEVAIDHVYRCGSDVVVISHHDGLTKTGIVFDSPLVQVFSVRDDKIVLLRDFADTDSWRRKLAASGPADLAAQDA
jgi:ketosteroid isomerase-like protein